MPDIVTAIKERPILFSSPMCRAILSGSKTQMRRPVDLRYVLSAEQKRIGFEQCADPKLFHRSCLVKGAPRLTVPVRHPDDAKTPWSDCCGECLYAPWDVGDRLWVRETFCVAHGNPEHDGAPHATDMVHYRADGGEAGKLFDEIRGWRPSIFMPRCYSRLTLEITDVRAERLQDISEDDARSEGVQPYKFPGPWWQGYVEIDGELLHQQFIGESPPDWMIEPHRMRNSDRFNRTAAMEFSRLWDSLNAKRGFSWEANPWVWAVSFKRLEPSHA